MLLAWGDEVRAAGCDGAQQGRGCIGTRRDKDVSSEATVLAAFAPDDIVAARATGLEDQSLSRAQTVCAEALADFQERAVAATVSGLEGGFAVVGRSCDETPFHLRKSRRDGHTVSKFLGQR